MSDPALAPEEILRCLATLDRPGEFYATGAVETSTPAIGVDGAPLSFPLPAALAAELIARAELAPYGRGGETLIDPEVRKVWQIGADRVKVGPRWARAVERIAEEAAHGLGIPGAVRAELYKLLVYERGSFFVPHRDTEKAQGMFATLVVALPSTYVGGELVVRHGAREVTLDLRRDDPAEVAWCAFYADCLHEVRPITDGHRLCLVYNLVREGGALAAPDRTEAVEEIAAALRAYAESDANERPSKLAFALEHHYTPDGLGFAGLKNGDRAAAAALLEAAGRAGCEVHLAMIAITESGTAQDNYLRSRRQRPYDDDYFEVIEVLERSIAAEDWRAPDGGAPAFGPIPMEPGELWPADAIDEEEPDEQHYHEATGNEGAEFRRTYRRAALVVWPAGARLAVLAQASPASTVALLEQERDRDVALDLAGRILARWDRLDEPVSWRWGAYVPVDAVHQRMLGCLLRLEAPSLVERFLEVVERPLSRAKVDWAAALSAVPAARAGAAAARVVRGGRLDEQVALVRALVDRGAREAAAGAAEALAEADLRGWVTAAEVAGVLACLWEAGASTSAAERFVARAAATIARPEVVVDAATALAAKGRGRPGWEALRGAALARLDGDLGPEPTPPADLARPASWRCTCADCVSAQRFLASPTEATWSLKANQHRRTHVEGFLSQQGAEVDRQTLHTNPKTLVCTKNRRRYDEAVRRRARALEVVAALGGA